MVQKFSQFLTKTLEKFGFVFDHLPVRLGMGLFVFALIVGVVLFFSFNNLQTDFWENIFIEFGGAIFDILIFGVLLAIGLAWTERSRTVERQLEIIEDLKKSKSEDGKLRIAGALRRLNRFGKTKIDFRGLELENFHFYHHGINNLSESVFWDGFWFKYYGRNSTRLVDVSFAEVNCSDVVFSKADLFNGLVGRNLEFYATNLEGALFEGAQLTWDQSKVVPNEAEWWINEGHNEDGQPKRRQIYSPHFDSALLNKASFKGATLERADFRSAKNVLGCNFTGTKGLRTCFFDEAILADLQKKYPREFGENNV